jgi:hypothetical protein
MSSTCIRRAETWFAASLGWLPTNPFDNCIAHSVHVAITHLGVDGQRQLLVSNAFGDWEIAARMAKLREGFLEVKRHGIMLAGVNSPSSEEHLKRIALGMKQTEDMVHVAAAGSFLSRLYAHVRQPLLIARGNPPPCISPSLKVA